MNTAGIVATKTRYIDAFNKMKSSSIQLRFGARSYDGSVRLMKPAPIQTAAALTKDQS
jgi:hypothetical protein